MHKPVISFKSSSEVLFNAYTKQRLSHALLISYPSTDFTNIAENEIIKILLWLSCLEAGPQGACYQCDSCRMISNYKNATLHEMPHPDLLILKPENTLSGYSIDQIRDFSRFFSLKQNLGANKVVWIQSPEDLGKGAGHAANALLKILEEPRPQHYLILSTFRPHNVLHTLKSRCQQFRLKISKEELLALKTPQENLAGWEALFFWIKRPMPMTSPSHSKMLADYDSFWTKREQALEELLLVHRSLWTTFSSQESFQSRVFALEKLKFFEDFELLIRHIKSYAQPQLQWLSFRNKYVF